MKKNCFWEDRMAFKVQVEAWEDISINNKYSNGPLSSSGNLEFEKQAES